MDIKSIATIEFWQAFFDRFALLGPFVPILLAAMESLIPPLPLIAIVTLNVASHGVILGSLYSIIGTDIGCTLVFLFFRYVMRRPVDRASDKHDRIRRARIWVGKINAPTLFLIALLPFTPSAFLNFAFGVSGYPVRKYLITIYLAKFVMIGLLALFGQSFVSAFERPYMIVISIVLVIVLYYISKKIVKMHDIPK